MSIEEARDQQMQARLAQTETEMEILNARQASDAAHDEFMNVSGLKDAQSKLRAKFDQMKNASGDNRKQLEGEFNQCWMEFQDKVDAVFAKLDASGDAFLKKSEADLREIDAEIAYLDALGDTVRADLKAKVAKSSDELREHRKVTEEHRQETEKTRHAATDEVKSGFQRAWAELKTSLRSASDTLHGHAPM